MDLIDIVAQVRALLQQQGRLSYRIVQRQFALDDAALEDVKFELIDIQEVAIDKDGKMLVWVGEGEKGETDKGVKGEENPESRHVQSPASKNQNQQAQSPIPNPQPPAAERRQLTVMFCDLVGSTALSAQLDPEELRDVVRGYQQTSAAVIERFGGHIAQYLGDGLLVYFGYPVAHEDDATRAVRTGLAILREMRGQGTGDREQKKQVPLQVRIGIHTGLVVVGEMGGGQRQEQLALGETPNIAARVQGAAQPDEVVISAATYRLVEGLFVCEDRGQPELKGVAAPLTLYRVVKESEAQSRFQVVARQGLTPLVGREHEYGLLQDRWQRVTDGAGQIVLLSGEPGIGKSRLVEALKERVEHDGARCLELRCSPYAQNSALQPVIEHLQRTLHLRPEDSGDEKLQKLKGGVPQALPLPEVTALVAAMLSLPHPADVPPLTLSPQKQKERTYEVLVAWLCAEAKQQAVTYAWEDLHWADPSTLEFLTLFLQQVPTTRLLAVLTYRPEFTPPWGSHSYLSQLTLSRLAQSHVAVMVDKVTGGKALPAEIVRQISSKTDGVPLFVEELTKMVVESGLVREVNGHYELTGPLPPLAIPSTLQDSLMARLDRLATVREIAQIGATIGREFSYELLKAVSPLTEDALQQGLRQLVDTELVFQSGVLPQARYLFKHALVQDTAYQSLLKSRRQQLHQTIGKVLEEQFSQTVETQPELVAHHFTEAGLVERALPYWQQASERATKRSANVEAIGYLTKALELLHLLPDTPERVQRELVLQLTLGGAVMATKGWGAPEGIIAYTRARVLCQRLGETTQLFPVLFGLWAFHVIRAEHHVAKELGEQLLRIAQSVQDPALLLSAHLALGCDLLQVGELAAARVHLDAGIALYDPKQHHALVAYTVVDPGVACLRWAFATLMLLGYPDGALRRMSEARRLAENLNHPFSLAFALQATVVLYQSRQQEPSQELMERLVEVTRDQEILLYSLMGNFSQGWRLVNQGQGKEGVAQMSLSVAALQAAGMENGRAFWLFALAEAHGKIGQVQEGLTILAEALAFVDKTEERYYEAELYRLKGELTLQKLSAISSQLSVPDTQAEAEKYFLKAIEVAQNQQAKSWELRAATSLARLWQQQGNRVEAHSLLSEVYNWFTEGFDTKDLLDAKTLLVELE